MVSKAKLEQGRGLSNAQRQVIPHFMSSNQQKRNSLEACT